MLEYQAIDGAPRSGSRVPICPNNFCGNCYEGTNRVSKQNLENEMDHQFPLTATLHRTELTGPQACIIKTINQPGLEYHELEKVTRNGGFKY